MSTFHDVLRASVSGFIKAKNTSLAASCWFPCFACKPPANRSQKAQCDSKTSTPIVEQPVNGKHRSANGTSVPFDDDEALCKCVEATIWLLPKTDTNIVDRVAWRAKIHFDEWPA
jgi:hypothetical protein